VDNCPNLFSGQGAGGRQGARLCHRYVNGTLTEEKLWPWPMDDRIKVALARGGSQPLSGEAGPGYAAGTVTAEIVARYGPIAATCGCPPDTTPPAAPRDLVVGALP
jgi:hypothetical protein